MLLPEKSRPFLELYHNLENPFIIDVPHAGENCEVIQNPGWLVNPLELLMDVDRFVSDLFFQKDLASYLFIKTHRYLVDVNHDQWEIPKQVSEKERDGILRHLVVWEKNTQMQTLRARDLSLAEKEYLKQFLYEPYHILIRDMIAEKKKKFPLVIGISAHSMPSMPTAFHEHSNGQRPEICISNGKNNQKTAADSVLELLYSCFAEVGFECRKNYPYSGGFVVRQHGQPENNIHYLQIEIRRDLYMHETSKLKKLDSYLRLKEKIQRVMSEFYKKTLEMKFE